MGEPLAVDPIVLEHFGVTCEVGSGGLTVKMRGNADGEVQSALGALLRQVDAEARRLRVKLAFIDIVDLYFMSSSCISLFVRWIDSLSKAQGDARYSIRFVSNPNLRWQKRTLSALSAMGQTVVTIE